MPQDLLALTGKTSAQGAPKDLTALIPKKMHPGMTHTKPGSKTAEMYSAIYDRPQRTVFQYIGDQFEASAIGSLQLLNELNKLVGGGGLDILEDPKFSNLFQEASDEMAIRDKLTSRGTAAAGIATTAVGTGALTAIPRAGLRQASKGISKKLAAGKPVSKRERGIKSISDSLEYGKPTGAPFGLTGGTVGAATGATTLKDPSTTEKGGGYWWEKATDVGMGWLAGRGLDSGAQMLSVFGRRQKARAFDKETFGGNLPRPLEADRAIAMLDPEAYTRRQKWLGEDSSAGRTMRNKMQRMDENIDYNVSAIRGALTGDDNAVKEMGWNPGKASTTGVDRKDVQFGSGFDDEMEASHLQRNDEQARVSNQYNQIERMEDANIPAAMWDRSLDEIAGEFNEELWTEQPIVEKVFLRMRQNVNDALEFDEAGNVINDKGIGLKTLFSLDKEINKALQRSNKADLESHAALTKLKTRLDGEIDRNLAGLTQYDEVIPGGTPDNREVLLNKYRKARREYAQFYQDYVEDPYVNMWTSGEHSGARVSTRMLGDMWEESANLDPISKGLEGILKINPNAKPLFKRDFFNSITGESTGNRAFDISNFRQKGGDIFLRNKKKPITDMLYDKEEMDSISSLHNQVNFRYYDPNDRNWTSGFAPGELAHWISYDLPVPGGKLLNKLMESEGVRASADFQGKMRRGRGYGIPAGLTAGPVSEGAQSYFDDPSRYIPGYGRPTDWGVRLLDGAHDDTKLDSLLKELENKTK